MSNTDIKHVLRKLSFPDCAMEALIRIEPIINNRHKQNLVMSIVHEFIFPEATGPDGHRLQGLPENIYMTMMQEYQVIMVLVKYFSKPGPEETRNAIFLSLFATNINLQRMRILSRMISTAVAGYVAPLLSAAGCYLQQVGCGSTAASDIARTIIQDFMVYANSTSERLKSLPLVAPHFAGNLITAITEHYMKDPCAKGTSRLPPDAMLVVLSDWMYEHPQICLASQQRLALPSGAIAMPMATPLIGLVRWLCILPLKVKQNGMSILHMAVLRNLLQLESVSQQQPRDMLNAQQLVPIANFLRLKSRDSPNNDNEAIHEQCVERFAQILVVGFDTKCITGNIAHLILALEAMPQHFLIQHVINNAKATNHKAWTEPLQNPT